MFHVCLIGRAPSLLIYLTAFHPSVCRRLPSFSIRNDEQPLPTRRTPFLLV